MEKVLGYSFKNQELLEEALTHPSYKHVSNTTKDYNRLEFLGDSVLNLAISEIIFAKYPSIPEGELSILHSTLVNKTQLAQIAKLVGLNLLIKMDQGEERNGGRENKNNLEDSLEAVIGAIFLDSNYNTTKGIVESVWGDFLASTAIKKDDKSTLQEWLQQNNYALPIYRIILQTGAAHQPEFTIEVEVLEGKKFSASSSVKKDAEFKAAHLALEYINKHYIEQLSNEKE